MWVSVRARKGFGSQRWVNQSIHGLYKGSQCSRALSISPVSPLLSSVFLGQLSVGSCLGCKGIKLKPNALHHYKVGLLYVCRVAIEALIVFGKLIPSVEYWLFKGAEEYNTPLPVLGIKPWASCMLASDVTWRYTSLSPPYILFTPLKKGTHTVQASLKLVTNLILAFYSWSSSLPETWITGVCQHADQESDVVLF